MSSRYSFLSIEVSSDKMEVRLSISTLPASVSITSIQADMILDFLRESGIQVGILEKAIYNLVADIRKTNQLPQGFLVAKGVSAGINPETVLTLKVKGISSPDTFEQILGLKFRHFTAVQKIGEFDRVHLGSDLLTLPRSPFAPGTDVYGKRVEANSNSSTFLKVGEGISFDASRNTYVSQVVGIVSMFDRRLQIIPVIYDAAIDIQLDNLYMSAKAVVFPAHPTGKTLVKKMLDDALAVSRIQFGLIQSVVDDVIKTSSSSSEVYEVEIARGILPVEGTDGKVEFLIDLEENLRPKIDAHGNADFRNISLIKAVEDDMPLARLVPPTKGKPGKNLYGSQTTVIDGKEAKLPVGSGTKISPSNPNVLIAATKGSARLSNGLVEITECLVIQGSVDFSSGNINYPKTVKIEGDIKSGFSVDVGGDLEVTGIIEDAKVNVGGKVLIRAGFMGNGNGVIEARDTVGLAYLRNQTVRSRKDVMISGESINSKIYARGTIDVRGSTLGIVGGTTSARHEIICESAGNETGVKTLLEVGIDFALIEERFKTEEKLKELSASRIKIDTHLGKLLRIKKIKKILPDKETEVLQKLIEMRAKVGNQLSILDERLSLIKGKLSEIGQSQITIKRTIWPGVVIKIGEFSVNIDRKVDGRKVFMLRDKELKSF